MPKFTVRVPVTAWACYDVEADDTDHAMRLHRDNGTDWTGDIGHIEDWNSNHWEVCADDSN